MPNTTVGNGKRNEVMTLMQIEKTKITWPTLSDVVHVPHGDVDYQEQVAVS